LYWGIAREGHAETLWRFCVAYRLSYGLVTIGIDFAVAGFMPVDVLDVKEGVMQSSST